MIGKLIDLSMGMDGSQRITIATKSDLTEIYETLKDSEVDFSISKHREKRTLNANSYAWALIGKIADKLRANRDDIYREMLRRYGQGGMISVQDKFSEAFCREWKYHEEVGRSDLNGKTFVHYRFWVGSSQYNSQEMAILIDGIISEAKELGIDTDTPERIALLIDKLEDNQ